MSSWEVSTSSSSDEVERIDSSSMHLGTRKQSSQSFLAETPGLGSYFQKLICCD
ncbi:hypothetical protein Sjap_004871 [Stephania japonica]|uniref:Uncharacterized protein n=1 Tax=Stephania japonica TaxID=461633 RepID=A0AAP0PHD6_9MAGN